MTDNKVLFIHIGPHPNHERFAKAITNDQFSIRHTKKNNWWLQLMTEFKVAFSIPRTYDVYLVESYYPIAVYAKKLGLLPRNSIIINIAADPSYYDFFFKRETIFTKKLNTYLMQGVDGYLAGSTMVAGFIEKITRKDNIELFPHFVEQEKYNLLKDIQPNLSANHILFIAHGDNYHCKGLDLLIAVFKLVQSNIRDAKLTIIGSWSTEMQERFGGKNINFAGYVPLHETGSTYFKNASLYVHLGRGESFGLTITEAMTAGLPCMVSEWTGAKDVVEKIRKDFILPLDKNKVAEKIIEYFNYTIEEKETLSNEFRKIGYSYNETDKCKDFIPVFKKLIHKVQKS